MHRHHHFPTPQSILKRYHTSPNSKNFPFQRRKRCPKTTLEIFLSIFLKGPRGGGLGRKNGLGSIFYVFWAKIRKKKIRKKKFFFWTQIFFCVPMLGSRAFNWRLRTFQSKKLHLGVSPLVALNFKASLTTINSPVFRVSALKNEWFT